MFPKSSLPRADIDMHIKDLKHRWKFHLMNNFNDFIWAVLLGFIVGLAIGCMTALMIIEL